MSIKNLLAPNSLDLYCSSVTVNSNGGGLPIFICYNQNDVTLTNNTQTPIPFAQLLNEGSFSTSGTAIRVPKSGSYLFILDAAWEADATVNATPYDRLASLSYGGSAFVSVDSKVVGAAAQEGVITPTSVSFIKRVDKWVGSGSAQDIVWRAIQQSGANLVKLKGGLDANLQPYSSLKIMYVGP